MIKVRTIHFIGIGGIGMSALARMMLHEGKMVSGSDGVETELTKQLQKEGIKIFIGQKKENIPKHVDVVVYTVAIPSDNPELTEARKHDIPVFTYSHMLGEVSRGKYTIAISGTHGKTTTTAMIAEILIDAGLSPTVIVGSLLSKYNSNFIAGTSKYFVVEACEYKRSFHDINPDILVITNIEEDHLDYYKDITDIEKAFEHITNKVPEDGYVVCGLDESSKRAVENSKAHIFIYNDNLINVPKLIVAGNHNRMNAAAALTVADVLGVARDTAQASLGSFEGTWRRMELKGKMKLGEMVYDDYAHHPTEIEATLLAFKERFPESHLRVVFQPHLYSRTKQLQNGFATSFASADEVIILPIYAAREENDETISHEILAKAIREHHRNVQTVNSPEEAVSKILEKAYPTGITVTMGAGNVYTIAQTLITK